MNNNYDKYIFKFVILGAVETGKSSIVRQYIDNVFYDNNESTIGASFHTKKINNKYSDNIRIEIWDTAGHEKYEALMPIYYRNSHICIIVYDISRRETFNKALEWVKKIKRLSIKTGIILVGNKNDNNNRNVSYIEGLEYANINKIFFFETSAKTNDNINNIFDIGCKYSYNYCIKQQNIKIDLNLEKNENKNYNNYCCIII